MVAVTVFVASFMTETVFASLFVTNISPFTGSYAIPSGAEPTVIVAEAVLVVAFITDTLFESTLATKTSPLPES